MIIQDLCKGKIKLTDASVMSEKVFAVSLQKLEYNLLIGVGVFQEYLKEIQSNTGENTSQLLCEIMKFTFF